MNTKTCPGCGIECLEDTSLCPNCRRDISNVSANSDKIDADKVLPRTETEKEIEYEIKKLEGLGGSGMLLFVLGTLCFAVSIALLGPGSLLVAVIIFLIAASIKRSRKRKALELKVKLDALREKRENKDKSNVKVSDNAESKIDIDTPLNLLKRRLAKAS